MTITIALAGNPNSGKTTIFNALTGSRQHVGNYSGVTVEKKEGTLVIDNQKYNVLDLPGTYSLSHHSPEERISQEELLSGNVDLIVTVVDSTALKRSLVFFSQLMQLNIPMVLVLNMADEAQKAGLKIDLQMLESLIACPVVECVAPKRIGIDKLKEIITNAKSLTPPQKRLRLGDTLQNALDTIVTKLPPNFKSHEQWIALKLLQDDPIYIEKILSKDNTNALLAIAEAKNQRNHIEADTKMDIQLFITEAYYGFVDGLLKEVTQSNQRADARAFSDKIDHILAHRLLGIPFFILIMYTLFWATFTLGAIPADALENSFFPFLQEKLIQIWPEGKWLILQSLLVDGIIGGVGGVLVFLPNIIIIFLGISFLEDSGYMARSAFIMDRLMHKVGLHGRSFIPLVIGFGCTIPGIMATRTIAGEKERLTTMFILPLMSCGARLPIWLLLIPVFFHESISQAFVMLGIYVFGILVALALSLLLRKTLFKGEDEPFVMELPPYRLPTLRACVTHMIERSWLYLKKAGTIILAVSILMWFLSKFPTPPENTSIAENQSQQLQQENTTDNASITDEEENPEQLYDNLRYSFAGRIGTALEPVFEPLGFDWRINTALIGAFAAKEVFVAQMGIVFSLGETDEESAPLRDKLRETYSSLTGISLIIFLLIATPCMATVAVMRRESGQWKWALLQFFGLTAIAYTISLLVYQVGSLFS